MIASATQSCLRLATGLALAALLIGPDRASAASSTFKTVTTADKTASIALPDGWKLAKGLNGFIYATGPNGESINLGGLVVVRNAPVGTPVRGEVAFAMPFGASMRKKFTQIIASGAARQGMPAPQLTFASETRMRLPMCEQFKGSLMAGGEARTFAAVTCSLQPDYLGLYKNLFFFAQTPSSRAAADKPVIAKIVNSYRVTAGMFKKMIAPYTPMPPASAMHYSAPYEDPTNSDCFDYNVIRESPPWEMPMHCGGWQPG